MSKLYIDKKSAIDALKAIRYGLWEIDIPSPTVPEYIEHHEQIKNMLEITDGWIKKLEEQSTADVVERKRGKWINDRGLYRCSYCNQLWTEWWVASKPIERMKKESPYCPMCGSYNGEEESENEVV